MFQFQNSDPQCWSVLVLFYRSEVIEKFILSCRFSPPLLPTSNYRQSALEKQYLVLWRVKYFQYLILES